MREGRKGLHIGIILDGNRRFAKRQNLKLLDGHKAGAKKVEEVISWCKELNIRELTLYSFSIENFNRPKNEIEYLFTLFREEIKRLDDDTDKKIRENKIKINFIGRLEMFPKDILMNMKKVTEKTKNNDAYLVNFAMAYGGRTEIIDAVRKIAIKIKNNEVLPEEIDEKLLTDNLYLSDEPDLIIRPGGEKRISNFLIWQGYYSEWFFSNKLWPEFTKEDIIIALKDFNERERRFGR